jgi:coatomer subunit beta'
LGSSGSGTTTQANYSLDAHDKGVNAVDFYPGPAKPYLVTTSNDKTVKIWDYLSKSCVQTLHIATRTTSSSSLSIRGCR